MRLCAACQHEIKDQMRFCPACGSHVAELIGTVLDGEYSIRRKIGESGFGTLYEALEVSTNLKVIVQVLYSHMFAGRTTLLRLHLGKKMAAIDDCDIAEVRAFGFGEGTGTPYLVLQFFDGIALAERLKEKPLDQKEALSIVVQVGLALQVAHEAGVFHGALTPMSIWLVKSSDGSTRVKVTDLGLSELVVKTESPYVTQQEGTATAAPAYLSPERSEGNEVDVRSDLYSLGTIAYEMLAGRVPFQGASGREVAVKQVTESPVPLRDLVKGIPTRLEAAIMRAIEREPLKRHASAGRFAEEIEKAVEEAKPVFCRRCGSQLRTAEYYCINCGTPRSSAAEFNDTAGLPYPTEIAVPVAARPDESESKPLYMDENVQFTVFRPRTLRPLVWSTLLAFAHLAERRSDSPEHEPDPVEEVQRQAEQFLGDEVPEYQKTVQDSSLSVPREGEITLIPSVPGIEFNPPNRTFLWQESVHREEFRLRASQSLDGQTARGRLSVFLGSILLADVTLSIRVDSKQAAEPASFEPTSTRSYRKIFASYSHLDAGIVDQFERLVQAFGDEYLRDVTHLRAGEVWSERLEKMILEADIFQLFWSTNSMRSRFVQREWEFALSRRKRNFIRPTYWEEPLPAAPEMNLPPEALTRLHFQRIVPSFASSVGEKQRYPVGPPPDTPPTPPPQQAPIGESRSGYSAPETGGLTNIPRQAPIQESIPGPPSPAPPAGSSPRPYDFPPAVVVSPPTPNIQYYNPGPSRGASTVGSAPPPPVGYPPGYGAPNSYAAPSGSSSNKMVLFIVVGLSVMVVGLLGLLLVLRFLGLI